MSAPQSQATPMVESEPASPYDDDLGQTAVFPLLDTEAAVDQDTLDAYAYLSSVRSQAAGESSVYFSARRKVEVQIDRRSGGDGDGNGYTSDDDIGLTVETTIAADTADTTTKVDATNTGDMIIGSTNCDEHRLWEWQRQVEDEFRSIKSEITALQRNGALRGTSWPGPLPSTGKQWRIAMLELASPAVSHFFALDHSTAVRLVVYGTKWLSTATRASLSLWLWSLLLRLDKPLGPGDTAVVRELGQKALRLWNKTLDATNVSLVARHCWAMVVTIVGSYYGQSDLGLGARTLDDRK